MKKLLISILSIFLFFSIANKSIAEEGYIEKILDLNHGVENYKLNMTKLDYVYFYNARSKQTYNAFRKADTILKDGIIKQYNEGKISYYKMNGIVNNYNNFVYHTNKFFNYLSIKEIRPDYKEVDTAIINNYELSRSYYKKVRNLILSK